MFVAEDRGYPLGPGTLRQAQGIDEILLRSQIKSLAASQLPLMPEGVEQNLSRQDMADLMACLKGE